MRYIGSFEVTSGVIIVSDPCYDMNTLCCGNIDNVKNGIWRAHIKMIEDSWGGCFNSMLVIRHTDYKSADVVHQEKLVTKIGVDSGQCGFYDFPIFEKKIEVPTDAKIADWIDGKDGKWYGMCCASTDNESKSGVIPGGVVSSSGFGDGSYECFLDKGENGRIIGATLIFIDENNYERISDSIGISATSFKNWLDEITSSE